MPRISTDNYDTVASWNGSQDLFIVEQPDGTKVATPALLKQYVLAGVTETSEQYAECSTARNVAVKTVTLPGFKLEAGSRISVRFTDTGSSNPGSGNITLNVNGTGAKEIVDSHTNKTKLTYTSGGLFYNNLVDDFVYDGTYWVYMNRDNNTTYSSKTAASGGTATSLCTTGEKYTWNNKQNALTFDNVPTQNSNNPVKSGGVYSAMAPTAIWEGDATAVGTTYNMTRNYSDFKYLLVLAKTNVEVKTILIPTSSISATAIFPDVLSAGAWNATANAFTYNSAYGIKFTAANKFKLDSLSYNNANWILRPRAIYGIG
jgi:hypothetical protein